MRIISLLPSATEIVYALGHGPELVGRSAECDYPDDAGRLPVVMRARTLDAERTSREIDERVRAERGQGESLYALDIPLLRTLQPDLILTQDLCGVCSVTGEEVAQACASAGVRPRIVTLSPRTLNDVEENILTVGRALGADIPARGLVEGLDARLAAVRERGRRGSRSISILEWLDPPIAAGLWTPEMVTLAEGRDLLGPAIGAPGSRLSWEQVRRAAPEILVLSPCSFPVERTLSELAAPGIQAALPSADRTAIWVADEAYFSRPGPRLWDGLELVADLIDGRNPRAPLPLTLYRGTIHQVAA